MPATSATAPATVEPMAIGPITASWYRPSSRPRSAGGELSCTAVFVAANIQIQNAPLKAIASSPSQSHGVTATTATGSEQGQSPIVFTVTRTVNPYGPMAVTLAWSGQATLGTDYDVTAGPGGTLSADKKTLTLADVWRVVHGDGDVLGLRSAHPNCPVGQSIQGLLAAIDRDAARAVEDRLRDTTIAELVSRAVAKADLRALA